MSQRRAIHAPDWLTARPIAHRGLHSGEKGVVENTLASARAAIAGNYAIECDIQRTRDGEAMVFHDATLERLTSAKGRVESFDAREIGAIAYKESNETIVSLTAFLTEVASRVPVIVELKGSFDGDLHLAERAMAILADYPGPVALKSFAPGPVAHLRARGVTCPLGLVAEASYAPAEWPELSEAKRAALTDWRDYPAVEPDFLSWNAADLPHAVPMLCRWGIGMPVITWTVRGAAERAAVAPWTDQIVFEGFDA